MTDKTLYVTSRNDFVLYSGNNEEKAKESIRIAKEQDQALKDPGMNELVSIKFCDGVSIQLRKWIGMTGYRRDYISLSENQTQGLAKLLRGGKLK